MKSEMIAPPHMLLLEIDDAGGLLHRGVNESFLRESGQIVIFLFFCENDFWGSVSGELVGGGVLYGGRKGEGGM